jgi:replicative DNA helicase
MSNDSKKASLDYLGENFKLRLIAQILLDKKFGESIIDIIKPDYFGENAFKLILATIKEAYQEDNIIPDIGSLEFRIKNNGLTELKNKFNIEFVEKIKNAELNDCLEVQKMGMKFCQTQELKKAVREIHTIIEKNDITKYDECEQILRKALDHGTNKDDSINVFENLDSVLCDDYRDPIPTGIKGLDEIMDGGLSKGELGIILAATGVGKTTMITKIANTAKNMGKNVLQIFFEDDKKIIQRKHFSCWSGIELNELSYHKDLIKKIVEEKSKESGLLKLKRFPSDGTTMSTIKKYIRKQIAQGFKPDIILLDYIDCVEPSKKVDDPNVGEGKVMREFESMLSEYDMVGWTAVQGNRSSIRAEIVEGDQMGGSIKKAQIGHFIVSIAKGLEQKDNNTANMAIIKSRFGKSGVMFENIIFDNSKIQIEMNPHSNIRTRTEHNDAISAESKNIIARHLNEKNKRRNVLEQLNNVSGNNNNL